MLLVLFFKNQGFFIKNTLKLLFLAFKPELAQQQLTGARILGK